MKGEIKTWRVLFVEDGGSLAQRRDEEWRNNTKVFEKDVNNRVIFYFPKLI